MIQGNFLQRNEPLIPNVISFSQALAQTIAENPKAFENALAHIHSH